MMPGASFVCCSSLPVLLASKSFRLTKAGTLSPYTALMLPQVRPESNYVVLPNEGVCQLLQVLESS
jgi:hypothetical protein